MANTQKPEVSKKELDNAANLWNSFTKWMAVGTVVTIILVALLALITL